MGTDGGMVTQRCRAWVASLGQVPEWQALMAEQALALAALIDVEPNPAQAAAASRELRQIVGLLSPVASVVPRQAPDRPENWSPPTDPVGNLVSMVARKQQGSAGC